MKIVKAVLTCPSNPSQWNAWDSEGNYWYLRYRFGYGTATTCESEDKMTIADLDSPSFYFEYGDNLDGEIDLIKFCQLAGIELELEGMSSASTDSTD